MAYGLVALWPYGLTSMRMPCTYTVSAGRYKSVPKHAKESQDGLYTQYAHLKSVLVSTVRRMLERLWKTTRRMLVSKVSVSTLSVAPAVAGC